MAVIFLADFIGLVYVRYSDHVLFNRASALVMAPQIREAVGWLVYESDHYLTLTWDRDAGPPTIRNGDPKASGLVLLKSDILELKKFRICPSPPKEISDCRLNRQSLKSKVECALQPRSEKLQRKGKMTT